MDKNNEIEKEGSQTISIVDLLSADFETDFEFEPNRLGLTARTPEL